MFVGCSEISVNVIVKHKQHIGIIWPFCLPGGDLFMMVCGLLGGRGGEKKMMVCGLLGGISTQADTMVTYEVILTDNNQIRKKLSSLFYNLVV